MSDLRGKRLRVQMNDTYEKLEIVHQANRIEKKKKKTKYKAQHKTSEWNVPQLNICIYIYMPDLIQILKPAFICTYIENRLYTNTSTSIEYKYFRICF